MSDFEFVSRDIGRGLLLSSFLWLPLVFAAYAFGRRRVPLILWFVFVALEGLALVALCDLAYVVRE
jgi:hypothetical protein